jgi:hypothetical protein
VVKKHDPIKVANAVCHTADQLEQHHRHVTRLVDDWATTLTRGEAGSASKGSHSDPTSLAALSVDKYRTLDQTWYRALAIADGWARRILDNPWMPDSLHDRLRGAAQIIRNGDAGNLPTSRLYTACCQIDDVIGQCRPDQHHTPDTPTVDEPKMCPACASPHDGRYIRCDACHKLHQRNPEYDDDDFNTWVQRRVREGSLNRQHSTLHARDVA